MPRPIKAMSARRQSALSDLSMMVRQPMLSSWLSKVMKTMAPISVGSRLKLGLMGWGNASHGACCIHSPPLMSWQA